MTPNVDLARLPPERLGLVARDALEAFLDWKKAGYESSTSFVEERGAACYLAVEVGGRLRGEAGDHGYDMGLIVGHCFSVILGRNNPRHVRSLGEAAEATCKHFQIPEAEIEKLVADEMIPYALRVSGASGS